jgi:hypothetical protein
VALGGHCKRVMPVPSRRVMVELTHGTLQMEYQ